MSEADKMFGEAGYKKVNFTDIYGNVYAESYECEKDYIDFRLNDKEIEFDNAYENPIFFSVEKFKKVSAAIIKKCEELGWNS